MEFSSSLSFGEGWGEAKKKKSKLLLSHRYNRLPLLPSGPGGLDRS